MIVKKFSCVLGFIFLLTGELLAQPDEAGFKLADSLINTDQFEKGIEQLNSLIKTYGKREDPVTRGFAYLQMENVEKAKADYERALVLNPKCAKCYGNLGIIESGRGNYVQAMTYTNQYIKLDPTKSIGYVKRGEIEFQLGKFPEALVDFNKGMTLDPNSSYIYLWLSMTKFAQGNVKAALDDINSSIQYKPDVEYAYFVRGKCYIQLGRYQEAWGDIASCLRKNPSVSEYHTYAGIALYNLNQFEKASQAFNQSISLEPTNYVPYLYRSYLQYNALNFDNACADKQRAKQLLAKAKADPATIKSVDVEIDNYCNPSTIAYFINKGNGLMVARQFDKAVPVLTEGLFKFNDDPILLSSQGNAYMALGKFKEALGSYTRCAANISRLNPAFLFATQTSGEKNAVTSFQSELYNSICFAYLNLGNFDSATINMGKAITILRDNPTVANQPYLLSECLAKRAGMFSIFKKYKEADDDFTEALKVNPKSVTALVNRATMLINRNTIDNKENLQIEAVQPGDKKSLAYSTTPVKGWKQEEVLAAIKDCDAAIGYDPGNAMAYFLRAQANIVLKNSDYCKDVLKAKDLGMKEAAAILGVDCK